MPLAQEIYESLLKDPDLEIGQNQTREEAAKTEADFRARQYANNVKALSLATSPVKKNSIDNLFKFIENSPEKLDIVKALSKEEKDKREYDKALAKYNKTASKRTNWMIRVFIIMARFIL